MTMIRCPNCRGMKQVAKLGGMMGDCNMCLGKGQILEADKVKPVIDSPQAFGEALESIKRVAECVPASDIVETPAQPDVKIDGKKALYKRKKA